MLAAEGSDRSEGFALEIAMLHSYACSREGVWIEGLKGEEEREETSLILSGVKMVEKI